MTRRPGVEAVIFDWGGTLTRWHDVDFHAESLALAQAVVDADHDLAGQRPSACTRPATRSGAAPATTSRARRSPTCSPRPGSSTTPSCSRRTTSSGSRTRSPTRRCGPLFEALRAEGIKVGVLSNTIWPRAWHEAIFERDGVRHLIDGDVYTSEIPWTKPSPLAFGAAMEAVGATDPARCVYVGDRLFDDIWGAQNAGLRAIHVPLSTIPADQVGHTEGEPDASRTGSATCSTIVRRLALTVPALCRFVQCRNVRDAIAARAGTAVACFCRSKPVVPPHPRRRLRTARSVQASAVRVLVRPGEHLGSSPEGEFTDRCVRSGPRPPSAAARRRCSPPARRTSSAQPRSSSRAARAHRPRPCQPPGQRVRRRRADRVARRGR